MKISVDGFYHLDTEKAKRKYYLTFSDGSDKYTGAAYLSPSNLWYVEIPPEWPPEWPYGHQWKILGYGEEGARALLEYYIDFMDDCDIMGIMEEYEIDFD